MTLFVSFPVAKSLYLVLDRLLGLWVRIRCRNRLICRRCRCCCRCSLICGRRCCWCRRRCSRNRTHDTQIRCRSGVRLRCTALDVPSHEEADRHENDRQILRRLRKEVGRTTRTKHCTGRAATAEAATSRCAGTALHQNQDNHRNGDNQINDVEDQHRSVTLTK